MKNFLVAMFAVAVAGCGAYNVSTVGIEEDTILILRSESLVGLSVRITPDFSRVITDDDLTEFTMGIGGVTDPEIQNLETVTLKVESGKQRLTIHRDGQKVYERELQFTSGQTRELRVRL